MTNLSLAAQAILDAYGDFEAANTDAMAAALRAAADQVVPTEMDLPPIAPDLGHFRQYERRLTRQRLLAIAAEMEAQ